eukprot:CAMPEP_0119537196 /NCGR_PEP_ID=MMETSP1344-20130328/49920_1 /TAXON_ID=236787 /ORGANISM="Florenciella parvula, Strain CCMP2471" /LENGTH=63 /DNA_ID=CAMNT_0007579603 /DNA_START=27 /DNA_END=214 /DNA_ORIENTATION=-
MPLTHDTVDHVVSGNLGCGGFEKSGGNPEPNSNRNSHAKPYALAVTLLYLGEDDLVLAVERAR